jgi:putative ABC transport system substrate-binding protein
MSPNKQIKCLQRMLVLTLLVVICSALGGCGEKEKRVYRVGILSEVEGFSAIADGFKAKMTELGYEDGKNMTYDIQIADMDISQVRRVAERFVQDKVDLIFAFPTEASVAAKEATQGTDIPVVFANANIEGTDLVESVRQPGGNITGVRFPGPDNDVMRLEFLNELVPQAKRVLIVYNPDYPTTQRVVEVLRSESSSLGITLVEDHAFSVEQLRESLQKRAASDNIGIDAILLMPDFINHSPDGFAAIVNFANEHKVPVGGGANFTADLGAMFSFVPDFFETGMLAGALADKILKGTPTGTIPVVTPENHLRLNYRVIKELGLDVSEGLLSRANEIIR